MGEIYFPQLSSGAIAQYSLSKERSSRTVRNVMRDGRLISYPDFGAMRLNWHLNYAGLSQSDAVMLKACFDACAGPLQPMTFLDPTSNAFVWSSDLTKKAWARDPLIAIVGNVADPVGGSGAFTIVNNGQTVAALSQTVTLPSNYQYCFSVYLASPQLTGATLTRAGSRSSDQHQVQVGGRWTRVESSGRLNDDGNVITAGITLAPGQPLTVYGMQLEAQIRSSSYRKTSSLSGVFKECFWASEEIAISADGPNSFSAEVHLETTL